MASALESLPSDVREKIYKYVGADRLVLRCVSRRLAHDLHDKTKIHPRSCTPNMLQLLMAPLANQDASGIAKSVQERGVPHELLGESEDIRTHSDNPVGQILYSLIDGCGLKVTLQHLLDGFWYNPKSECLPMVTLRSLDDLCHAFQIAILAENYDLELEDEILRHYTKDEIVTILYDRIILLDDPQLPCWSLGGLQSWRLTGVMEPAWSQAGLEIWNRYSHKVHRNVEAVKACWLGITNNDLETIQTFVLR
jgi:hypothetical protein